MGKYQSLEKDIFSIFAATTWVNEDIPTYPQNFIGVIGGKDYLRVSIIASGEGINLQSSSGILKIDIFTKAGQGPSSANVIADKLDKYLVGKSINLLNNNVTQFGKSSLNPIGVDTANKSLYRNQYSIPFNYFGV
jgi:hypothetical protein